MSCRAVYQKRTPARLAESLVLGVDRAFLIALRCFCYSFLPRSLRDTLLLEPAERMLRLFKGEFDASYRATSSPTTLSNQTTLRACELTKVNQLPLDYGTPVMLLHRPSQTAELDSGPQSPFPQPSPGSDAFLTFTLRGHGKAYSLLHSQRP